MSEPYAHRRSTHRKLEPTELEAAVKRCIQAWCDTSITMTTIQARFPAHIITAARHAMTFEQLRSRG